MADDGEALPDNALFADIDKRNRLVVWVDAADQPVIYYRRERCPTLDTIICHRLQLTSEEREAFQHAREAWLLARTDMSQCSQEQLGPITTQAVFARATFRRRAEGLERRKAQSTDGVEDTTIEYDLMVLFDAGMQCKRAMIILFDEEKRRRPPPKFEQMLISVLSRILPHAPDPDDPPKDLKAAKHL